MLVDYSNCHLLTITQETGTQIPPPSRMQHDNATGKYCPLLQTGVLPSPREQGSATTALAFTANRTVDSNGVIHLFNLTNTTYFISERQVGVPCNLNHATLHYQSGQIFWASCAAAKGKPNGNKDEAETRAARIQRPACGGSINLD